MERLERLKVSQAFTIGLVAPDGSDPHHQARRVVERAGSGLFAFVLLVSASCSTGGTSERALRPPVSLYLLPNPASLPAGVRLWEAHLFPNETELIFWNRPACNGGTEIHLFVRGRPAGLAPRPYRPPGAFSNGGGICDYAAGPRPSDAVDTYQGNSLTWSGPAGIVNAGGSVNRPTLTGFVRELHAVTKSQWVASAKQAVHRASQNGELGPDA